MTPMFVLWGHEEQALNFHGCMFDNLRAAVRNGKTYDGDFLFDVEPHPKLNGFWGAHVNCHTVSHQAVLQGIPSVQLELPFTMRQEMVRDADLLVDAFARQITTAYSQLTKIFTIPAGQFSASLVQSNLPSTIDPMEIIICELREKDQNEEEGKLSTKEMI